MTDRRVLTTAAVDALASSANYLMVNAHGVAADLLHPQKLSREMREEMAEVLELYVKEVREALEAVEPWSPPSEVAHG